MKRIYSLFIALFMILSVLPFMASAGDYPVIESETTVRVDIETGGAAALFRFVPAVTDEYTWYATSDADTFGTLYDENMEMLSDVDDGGHDADFVLSYPMEAGVTYYLEARYYSPLLTGSFDVTLTQSHGFDESVIDPAPTCTQDGAKHYTCSYCGYQKVEVLPALGHSYEVNVTREPTCSQEGEGEYTCTVCGYFCVGPVETLPHNFEGIACADCGANPSGTCGENAVWSLNADGLLVISGTGDMTSYGWLLFRDYINVVRIDSGITGICSDAFYACYSMTEISIPDTVTAIGSYAFGDCTSLTHVTLPDGVTVIDWYLFHGCTALERVDFSDNVTAMGGAAFDGCTSLSQIKIPEGVTELYYCVFSDCEALTEVTLPDSLVSVKEAVFLNCTGLEKVEFGSGLEILESTTFEGCTSLKQFIMDENNPNFSAADNILYTKDMKKLVMAAPGIQGVCTVPDGVAEIDGYAFNHCQSLTRVILPDSVTVINGGAFNYCSSLTEINLPDGMTAISDGLFGSCSALETVAIPDSVTFIDSYAFDGCAALKEIEIPAGVTEIGNRAFRKCKALEWVRFTGDAPVIGRNAFQGVETTCYYPEGNATWTSDVMGSYNGTLTWVPYQEVQEVATGWSGACQWTLTSDGVLRVYGSGNMKNYGWNGGQPWAKYVDQIKSVVIENGVAQIGSGAFKDMTSIESVTLPDSGLSKIGIAAFYGCTSLKEIYIPEGIYTIWEYTFKNCTAMENVRLPKTLIKIDQGAFESCSALTELFLPTNTEIIGGWSFKACTAMKTVDMQWADATMIRPGAFKNCTALTKIILPANIQTLGDSCFYGIGATSFVVPETVTEIQDWCFARSSIKEITFEGSAPSIGTGAFNKIALTAYYPSGNATWTSDVMRNYGGTVTWTAQ